jgi:hypothetical protein
VLFELGVGAEQVAVAATVRGDDDPVVEREGPDPEGPEDVGERACGVHRAFTLFL